MVNYTFYGDLAPGFESKCIGLLNQVSQAAPSDSSVAVQIFCDSIETRGMICASSIVGAFHVTAESRDPLHLLEKLCAEFTVRLNQWKQNRFLEYPKKVLIVDDDFLSIQPIKESFQRTGSNVRFVCSPQRAVDELMIFPYDLLVLDWQMPLISGREVLRIVDGLISQSPLKKDHWTKTRLPLLIYSGSNYFAEDSIPETSHFKYLGSWPKTTKYPRLQHQARKILSRL